MVLKKLPAQFYKLPSGNEPVRIWLKKLDRTDRKVIGEDIATLEVGWPVGMPVCKGLGKGLWEVRSKISNNRKARVLFMVADEMMILLHGFIKKTQKTPPDDMALARKRMKEVQNEAQ